VERRTIAVNGTVQGVGFRPFVHGLASRLELKGFVRNQAGGVTIEVEGDTAPLDKFLSSLVSDSPPLAHIDELTWQRQFPVGDKQFRIESSDCSISGPVAISPDISTCEQCLTELFDPRDRRYRYPFINCTNCGPRLTIVTGAPYDRERTTMVGFDMCPACRAEYEDPAHRRFHAQPTACPVCGPTLKILDSTGIAIETEDPLDCILEALRDGKIVAIKGLGGYHLACDAANSAAVVKLRKAKRRDEKPFAVMVQDILCASALCEMDAGERKLISSPRRPIVLMRKRNGIGIADEIAPGNPFLGVMLPYTPLHHLLLREMQGVPLVMTSGNRSDEPIAIDEGGAIEQLAGIADLFLVHNRPIHVRCDDSVTRLIGGIESPVRRSRGYAPAAIPLPISCPATILAVGAQLKATFALGDDRRAIISHHAGDLDHFEGFKAFERDIALYEQLFSLTPALIAHDLHPDYASTRYALSRESDDGIKRIAIQHHHAHMASCMAEHGLDERVIGVTFDGSGLGTDGAIWGGEFLVGDYRQFQRAAHLQYVGLPGGEKAIRQPWRMAAAHLMDAGADCGAFEQRIDADSLRTIRAMLRRGFNSPQTSSIGRLFDAVASLIGLRDAVSYEGQAAIELEWLASSVPREGSYLFDIDISNPEIIINVHPMIRAIARDVDAGINPARIARRFHSSLVEMISDVCIEIRKESGIDAVVLSGGVFINSLLNVETSDRLDFDGFRVFRHQRVPPSDGGLSLGQVAIAASQMNLGSGPPA
jgi:hydrogenase maturation protein HypF